MDDSIHIVETGEGWEVWQREDSRPLGTYLTRGEAEEQARAAADAISVAVEDHDLPVDPTDQATT